MLRTARNSYICWRCLAAGTDAAIPAKALRSRRRPCTLPGTSGLLSDSRRAFSTTNTHAARSQQSQTPVDSNSTSTIRDDPLDESQRLNIRDRLRLWEKENPLPAEEVLQDISAGQSWGNFLTRSQTARTFTDEPHGQQSNPDLFDGDVLSDLRGQTSSILAGDLIETRFDGSRLPVLGICLGRHHGIHYFYMATGELLPYQSLTSVFTVNNYVDPAQLQPLVDILPAEPFTKPRNVLQHVQTPQALEAASELQELLTKFYADAVTFYQSALKFIERASEQVADPTKVKYMSLEELAERILPAFLKSGGKFSPHNLYAVHLALQRDGWGFRPLNVRWHRRNYIYEVRPSQDKRILEKVEERVRKLIDAAYLRPSSAQFESLWEQNNLGRFIKRARKAIQANRATRPWTPHGMIGPGDALLGDLPQWEEADLEYIRFMELWACHRVVPKSSQVDSLASTILRLTQMYKESDWVAHWTGVTFLQEIGWIPPWDIPARYGYRFPDVEITRDGRLQRPPIDIEKSLRPDIAEGARRDWGDDAKIFCVDSEQTADVDDGFSLERTDSAGEYWIHVHIADPASRIDPMSPLAHQLQTLPSSLYLAGYSETMLPPELEQAFSLDPEKPTLTFSAKVNEDGQLLDYKIEPGIARNVVHMTKEGLSSVLPAQGQDLGLEDDGHFFAVGKEPGMPPPIKQIAQAEDLTQKDKDDLLLLDRLGEALRSRRREKGQLPPMEARLPSPTVSFHGISEKRHPTDMNASRAWSGDPFIKFGRSPYGRSEQLVEALMHTAGEIAAKWCQSRNIAVPYSTQPEAVRNASQLEKLRAEVADPLTAAGKPYPQSVRQELFTLIGTSELSATPGPFYSTGLDAYTKSSSPLRRYTDLMVHWQIHAALAQERQTGSSLAGTDCAEARFLPWTRTTLAPLLPALQARLRQIREVDNRDGPSQWIFQALLRAWRFGEAPLPRTFSLEVDDVVATGIRGRLRDFHELPATLPLTRMGLGARLADAAVGDVLEVEIADVNVVTMEIEVQSPKAPDAEERVDEDVRRVEDEAA
ncbi:mitochondrial protein cyt-4 [Sodiomyces alkalinus F11]|uniref:Mitochondrial protein cyt-4 n=1 Tax=Sodiomyces alkalinus (strain CBS 110278 / VKM F-3762 / F11) TaxID=1314773 RepID=A0A3N2PZ10_SODAK|nr:mitochondrial protein cyt-4 [Sodiomyces alkalinus F11]ROT39734.1 mitochondrial protein cyt-4 [Sodiomyces alkalinus F11]